MQFGGPEYLRIIYAQNVIRGASHGTSGFGFIRKSSSTAQIAAFLLAK
jgi:hypothetical protein